MKVIIAGSRTCTDYSFLESAIKESGFEITAVYCGGAKGADDLGLAWAEANKIICVFCNPEWWKYGNYAGNLRNIDMGKQADALIALWDGKSTGTKHMITTMKIYEKPVFVKRMPLKQKSMKKEYSKHLKTGFFN